MESEIRKQKELQSAYDSFQRASQNRDSDPETFEQVRFRYYSLKNGPAWADQERKVIADKKMNPIVDGYLKQFNDLENQSAVQSAYTKSIAAIRDKQSSMKNGVAGTIDYLGNLLSEKLQKIGAFNRYIELTDPVSAPTPLPSIASPIVAYFSAFPRSFSTWLDVFIVILILLTLVILFRKSGIAFTAMRQAQFFPTQPVVTAT